MLNDQQRFLLWHLAMQESTGYLPMDGLLDRHAYIIFARNAYVGIWIAEVRGFLISRYKFSSEPFPFTEYHWDTGEPFGTVKPLSLIERCPFALVSVESAWRIAPDLAQALCARLDDLEAGHPVLPGANTLQARRGYATGTRARSRERASPIL